MQYSDESLRLLREIRDAQQALLVEYRRAAERSLSLQEQAVQRQEHTARLYRRVVTASLIAGGFVLVLILYLLTLLP